MLSHPAMLALEITLIGLSDCASNPYDCGSHPSGYNRADVDRDYMKCECKARLANEPHFSSGPQSPADHARAARAFDHQRDARTYLAAKVYEWSSVMPMPALHHSPYPLFPS